MAGGVCLAQRRCEARTSMKTCGEVVCVDASRGRSELFDYPKGFVRKGRSYCVSGGVNPMGSPWSACRLSLEVQARTWVPTQCGLGRLRSCVETCRGRVAERKGDRESRREFYWWMTTRIFWTCGGILVGGLRGGPEILTAVSGARALRMLMAEPFDFVICELRMPRMSGLELLAVLGTCTRHCARRC